MFLRKNRHKQQLREIFPARTVVWLLLFLCQLIVVNVSSAESSSDSVKKELDLINSKIQALNRKKLEQEGEVGKLQLKIKMLDKQVASNLRSLKKLNKRIRVTSDKLGKLNERLQAESAELQHHRELLANHIRALYHAPAQARMQTLLRPDGALLQQRNQVYFGYLHDARMAQLKILGSRLQKLESTNQDLSGELKKLRQLKKKAEITRQALKKDRRTRSATIAKLNKRLKSSQNKLKDLAANREQLNELLERLRFAAANPALLDKGKAGFAGLRGSLSWPLKGTVKKTGLAPGVTIMAPAGEKVHAISNGTVVFADWMRGFGLLIIIDHGGGYMSLYGRNQSLFRAPGDQVKLGSVIATAGKSGGYSQPGIYFEIRKDAKPLDPRKWCKGS
jgi:septal ring factor EnvC (AmiA/AmiB activator)